MKLGVISDIHSNYPALEAVLHSLDEQEVDGVVCVGDVLGVLGGSDEVVTLLRDTVERAVYGNHDTRFFDSRKWIPHREYEQVEFKDVTDALSSDNLSWVKNLPGMVSFENVVMAHARPEPDNPEGGLEYDDPGIMDKDYVSAVSTYFDKNDSGKILLLGHTHHAHAVDTAKFDGLPDILVLNPGSVGYPFSVRSEENKTFGRASFAVVETITREYTLCTVEYESTTVMEHLRNHGLKTGYDSRNRRSGGSMRSRHG